MTRLNGPLPADPVKLWEMVVGACATQHRMRMLVGNIKLVSKDNDRALLQVTDEMRPAAESAEQDLCTLLSTAWGEPVRVVIEGSIPSATPSPLGGGPGRGGTQTPAPAAPADTTPRTPIADHPLIKQAIELFGARVVGVQPRRKQAE